jgi:hypothetical protein
MTTITTDEDKSTITDYSIKSYPIFFIPSTKKLIRNPNNGMLERRIIIGNLVYRMQINKEMLEKTVIKNIDKWVEQNREEIKTVFEWGDLIVENISVEMLMNSQCEICYKFFSSSKSKTRHMKRCIITQMKGEYLAITDQPSGGLLPPPPGGGTSAKSIWCMGNEVAEVYKSLEHQSYQKGAHRETGGYILTETESITSSRSTTSRVEISEERGGRSLYIGGEQPSKNRWGEISNRKEETNKIGENKSIGEIIENKIIVKNAEQVVNNNQNNNYYIQNNIQIRALGDENPNWLTPEILHRVVRNINKAIPLVMEKKHFNNDFPENKNIKVYNQRDINKRLRVYENGRWRIKDSKQTFYQVLVEIYDVLSDALCSEDELDEGENTLTEDIKNLRRSENFIRKIQRIRPIWEDYFKRYQDGDKELLDDYWEDLKTLLLDRQLAIEQGVDS